MVRLYTVPDELSSQSSLSRDIISLKSAIILLLSLSVRQQSEDVLVELVWMMHLEQEVYLVSWAALADLV